MKISREELANVIIYQVGALKGFLEAEGVLLNHIKPHGALYGMAARDENIAHGICDAADVFKVPIYGLANTLHEKVYQSRGHQLVTEFFADLEYDADGCLFITRKHHAVKPEWAAERAVRAIREGRTATTGGTDIPVRADTICVHSDTPNSVEIARKVREEIASYLSGRV